MLLRHCFWPVFGHADGFYKHLHKNNMRFLPTTLLCLLLGLLHSCSPTSFDPEAHVPLEGTWELESATGSGHNVTYHDGQSYTAQFSTRTVAPTDYALTFTPQGRVYSSGTFTEEVTGTFQGETHTRTSEKNNLVGAGVWKLQGQQLMMGTKRLDEMELQIVTLTDDELVMQYDRAFTTTTRDGEPIDEVQQVTYILHRN